MTVAPSAIMGRMTSGHRDYDVHYWKADRRIYWRARVFTAVGSIVVTTGKTRTYWGARRQVTRWLHQHGAHV